MGIRRVAGLAWNRLLMRVDNSTGKGRSSAQLLLVVRFTINVPFKECKWSTDSELKNSIAFPQKSSTHTWLGIIHASRNNIHLLVECKKSAHCDQSTSHPIQISLLKRLKTIRGQNIGHGRLAVCHVSCYKRSMHTHAHPHSLLLPCPVFVRLQKLFYPVAHDWRGWQGSYTEQGGRTDEAHLDQSCLFTVYQRV